MLPYELHQHMTIDPLGGVSWKMVYKDQRPAHGELLIHRGLTKLEKFLEKCGVPSKKNRSFYISKN